MMANLDGSNQVVISHDKILIGEKPRALTYRPEGIYPKYTQLSYLAHSEKLSSLIFSEPIGAEFGCKLWKCHCSIFFPYETLFYNE